MTGGREPPARSGDVSHPRDRGGACLIPAGYRPATSGHGPGPGAAGSETTRSPEPLVATRGRCGGGHVADSPRLPRTGRQMAPAILRTRPAPGPGGGRGASRVTGHPGPARARARATARAHTHTHLHQRPDSDRGRLPTPNGAPRPSILSLFSLPISLWKRASELLPFDSSLSHPLSGARWRCNFGRESQSI